jgi:hypothetical protein
MIVEDDRGKRPEAQQSKPVAGWTNLHSWIFLGIVALGLLIMGVQNRYHYLSPFGLGKAYRIDKLFGSIQEFDPANGWVSAQLNIPNQTAMGVPPGSKGGPPQMPSGSSTPGTSVEQASSNSGIANAPAYIEKEAQSEPTTQSVGKKPQVELTEEERFKYFQQEFPEYGKEEFQLANDDLYPDWKKNIAPNGTWQEFLSTYRDFIQWWTTSGAPPEPGFKLWKNFTANKKK